MGENQQKNDSKPKAEVESVNVPDSSSSIVQDYRKIEDLIEWDKNPRKITDLDYVRLKDQITLLGQYKPLIINEKNEVLGGNMRLRAFKELGFKKVWVSVVHADTEEAKLQYALSDNDRAGYYDNDMLAKLVKQYENFDFSAYAVDIHAPVTIDLAVTVPNLGEENFDNQRLDEQDTKSVTCPKCGHEFEA